MSIGYLLWINNENCIDEMNSQKLKQKNNKTRIGVFIEKDNKTTYNVRGTTNRLESGQDRKIAALRASVCVYL